MNKTLLIGIGILIVIALGVGAVWAFSGKTTGVPAQPVATSTEPIATTTPVATTTPEKESDTAALGQRIYTFGVHITPLEVVSDSRCPMGVYCIQAGEIVVKVKLEDATHTEIVTMHQGSPVAFGNKHVALMSATPPKSQQGTIKPSDYRFTFSVAYGMGGEATGTLSGTMSIGPICPVEQVNNPCLPTPEMYAARKIAVYASDRSTLVATLTPNAQGAFSVSLPAGTYYVKMAAPQSGVGSVTGVPTTLVVKDGTTTTFHIAIDTGIR